MNGTCLSRYAHKKFITSSINRIFRSSNNGRAMDSMETNMQLLLEGKAMKDSQDSLVDYSLSDQVKELAEKGIESTLDQYKPICRKSVCYIVAAVLFNERDEVLMMQEAKSECAGAWYLPAGRVEPGEHLVDGVRREVLEETGLLFEPTTLVMVENATGNWYRFVFTGNVTGGQLKTVSQADSESLQASWVDNVNQLSLRSKDIIPLIDRAKLYYKEKQHWHKSILPAAQAHTQLWLRILVVIKKKTNNRLHVLLSEKKSAHLPICEINPNRSVHASMKKFIQMIFNNQCPEHRPHGLLAVEHSGQSANQKDGICLTVMVSCKGALEECLPGPQYTWLEVSSILETRLMSRLGKNMTLNLNVIR